MHHVVVGMGDGEAERLRALLGDGADVIGVPGTPSGLPLAQARNAGARHALAAGAELLVFLDVDCIPGPGPARALRGGRADGPALLCGPVAYLPPAPPGGYPATGLRRAGRAHPARPVPPEDGVLTGGDHTLFWTLSFAITRATWHRVGAFCEDYVGYGGEDTDYGQLARRAGVGSAGSAARGPTTSTIRRSRRRSSTSTTSCATPRSSTPLGLVADGGLAAAFAERGLVGFEGGRWKRAADALTHQ